MRRLVPLLGTGFASFAWGFAHGAREAAAFGIALLAAVAASVVYVLILGRATRARRRCPDRAFEDDAVDVRFGIENRIALPSFCPRIEDVFPPDKAARKRTVVYPAVPPRRAAIARYRGDCTARRGRYPLGPARWVVSDPLGLFTRHGELASDAEILIYPRVSEIPGLPTDEPAALFDSGPLRARLQGASLDFLGTREYRPGDALKHIHWASMARHGRVIVKQFEPKAASFVTVFVDLHRLSMRGLGRISTLEYSIRVAGSVTTWICRRGGVVRVVGHGAEPFCVGPGGGESHLHDTLEQLALVKADGDVPLDEVLRRWAPDLEAPSTAVVIFSAMSLRFEQYVDVVAMLRARRVEITAVLVDEESFTAIWREQQRPADDRIAVEDLARALLAEGASVVTVRSGEDLTERFRAAQRPGDWDEEAIFSAAAADDDAAAGAGGAAVGGSR